MAWYHHNSCGQSLHFFFACVCRCSGNGGPQTCLPVACGVARVVAQYGPSLSAQDSRPSRGAKPRGADDTRLPQERPHQAGSRGGREIKAGVPREVLVTQAVTIETRRTPSERRPVQCPCFLFGAKGASTGVEYRGIRQRLPFQCNETKTSRAAGWRSPWSPRRRHRQCLWQPKTNFSQDNLY